MAQRLLALVRQVGKARTQMLALSAASAGIAAYGASREHQILPPRLSVPGFTPLTLADAGTEAQESVRRQSGKVAAASIALTGFEDVKDVNGFVSSALDKTLKYQKSSPLHSLVSGRNGGSQPSTAFGEQPPPPTIDPAAFYAQFEKQPLSEKVIVLDDIVDSVIREAERSAEVSALTVGMVGGGVACYALLGWVGDLALPGVGTVFCSAVAGAAGHNRAKAATKKTRTRFLNAILDSPLEGRNTFVEYLSAPSLDVKQRIASDTRPFIFFRDFFIAVQPLLRQSQEAADAAGRAVLVQLD